MVHIFITHNCVIFLCYHNRTVTAIDVVEIDLSIAMITNGLTFYVENRCDIRYRKSCNTLGETFYNRKSEMLILANSKIQYYHEAM